MKWKEWIVAGTDLILPRYCAVCGKTLLRKEKHLCLECAMKLPLSYFWTEKINPMADRFNERLGNETIDCPGLNDGGAESRSAAECRNAVESRSAAECREGWRERTYAYATALFLYKGKYRALTKAVKYKCDIGLGLYLGEALGRKLRACPWMEDVDLVVPVPLHILRKLGRGYNQAEIVARAIVTEIVARGGVGVAGGKMRGKFTAVCSRDAKPAVNTEVLVRRRRTKSQARLHMSQKAKNVAGAFEGRMENLSECPSHILLVDDVFTSGSTLCECQRALRTALISRFGEEGMKTRISIATLAYVGD